MEYKEWLKLAREMAIETIVQDLADVMLPCEEGRKRAIAAIDNRSQEALNVQYRMSQAINSLEKLGYEITKKI